MAQDHRVGGRGNGRGKEGEEGREVREGRGEGSEGGRVEEGSDNAVHFGYICTPFDYSLAAHFFSAE